MLTRSQADEVWRKMFEAEVRSLYFADLAAHYTTRKQQITAASFFLSSGAAASLWAALPAFVPLAMAVVVALLTAYSLAVNLDKAATKMAELHSTWNHLADDYQRLWHHWQDEDAEQTLDKLLERARRVSAVAPTEVPYKRDVMQKWEQYVASRYSTTAA